MKHKHPVIETKFRILIAPLDWGLGHATRCIPIVRFLVESGNEVVLAAEDPAATLLQNNFPGLRIIPLRGYRIRYSRHKSTFTFRILLQVPKILASIRREKRWLGHILKKERFDLIISDNRYGLHAAGTRSVILTHQLQIISGLGAGIDRLLRKWHYKLLEKFERCWVADSRDAPGLGGILSHPGELPRNVQYIGLLSQFAGQRPAHPERSGQILILLSGPEPMRSSLEKTLLGQIKNVTHYRFVMVGGTISTSPHANIPDHLVYYPWLTSSALRKLILEAELVVCRSGYSTLMDLAILKKKALLIPTPGQTEQEYLANLLSKRTICMAKNQPDVDLRTDIANALKYPGLESHDKNQNAPSLHLQQAFDRLLQPGDAKSKT